MQPLTVRMSLLIALLLVFAPAAQAAVLNVGGGGYATIQSAITAASNGDTIIVAAGTYPEHINFAGKSVTIRSSDPDNDAVVAATIIDGTANGTCVTIANGEGQGAYEAVLEGFTITNGAYALVFPTGAGGIYIENASPIIRKNVISLNQTAADGGGICVIGGAAPEVNGNTIVGNTAEGWGGGVFVMGEVGGAVTAQPTILGNRVTGNETAWDGGGLCLFESVDALVRNNIIDENIADEVGGGIFAGYDVAALIESNTVVGNEARGIDLDGGTVPRVGRGGGLACFQSVADTTVDSCIFWANTAVDDGDQISLEASAYLAVDYSDVQGGQPGVFVEVPGPSGPPAPTLVWGAGNIDALPLFASAADYHLQSVGGRYDPAGGWVYDAVTSPCIDAGNPILAYSSELAPNGHVINQGAYGNTAEASKTPVDEPFLSIGAAQFDVGNSLMYFDLIFESSNGLTGSIQGFGVSATLSGADAGHFTADPDQVRNLTGAQMDALVAPAPYAWSAFFLPVVANSTAPETMAFGQNAWFPGEYVALESIAQGTVVARFYYAWDGVAASEVFVNIESYAGVDPAPSFDIFETGLSLSGTVLNDYSNIIVLAGDPEVSIATEDDLDWVYQNTPGTLANGGHKVALTVTVDDLNGNDSVSVAVGKVPASGPGEVTIEAGATGLEKLIVGSPLADGDDGALTLEVVVTGDVAGQTTVPVPFTCRRLGDVDGNGGAEPGDVSVLILKLNGTPPGGYHDNAFDLDANGGAEPGDVTILINLLNGLPVP